MFRFAFIALIFLQLRTAVAWALPWIATEYLEIHVSTIVTAEFNTFLSATLPEVAYTNTVTVIPTKSTFPALSIVTTTGYYSDLILVEVLVPTGVGTTKSYYNSIKTYNYVQFVYSAPTRCSPGWVWTTDVYLNAPAQVQLTPKSVFTTASVPTVFGATVTEYIGYINPTDIPESSRSSMSSVHEPYFSSSCTIPSYYLSSSTNRASVTSAPKPSTITGAGTDYSDCLPFIFYFGGIEIGRGYICDDGTHYTQGVSVTTFVLIWVFTWFGVFFILGLIESYINFAKLSQGRKARRGMPCLFAGLAPLLSCFCLCLRTPGYVDRTADEQAILKAEWKKTPFGTKISRWIKWGFRDKYPTFLGDAPARRSSRGATERKQVPASMPPPQYSPPAGGFRVSSPPATAPVAAERNSEVYELRQIEPAHEMSSSHGSKERTVSASVSRV